MTKCPVSFQKNIRKKTKKHFVSQKSTAENEKKQNEKKQIR